MKRGRISRSSWKLAAHVPSMTEAVLEVNLTQYFVQPSIDPHNRITQQVVHTTTDLP